MADAGVSHRGASDDELAALAADSRIVILRQELESAVDGRGESKVQTLKNALFDLIERGFWRPGDKLPGEKELSIVLGLSLGTVQSAIRPLQSSGLLERRRGAGTFVAAAKELGSSIWHFRFRDAEGKSLLPWISTVHSVDEIVEQGDWSDFMGFAPSYIRICRVIGVDEKFNVYSEVYLEGPRFRPLLDTPLEVLSGKNLRIFLHERYNAPTLRAIHRLAMIEIPKDIAKVIGVTPGSRGINMKALSYSFRDTPMSYQRIVIPETPYELELLG
ncbi:GntR family transcriptional regulator [Pelagibius sp. 7325]|uniref:GntR family transcriptional regulator n=1 Tax=Pelagibius sp. 7325 TaxID=3131994 RepID=UPI0030EF3A62